MSQNNLFKVIFKLKNEKEFSGICNKENAIDAINTYKDEEGNFKMKDNTGEYHTFNNGDIISLASEKIPKA